MSALNPMFIVSLLVGVAFAYGVTALYLWVRETHRLEANTARAENDLREKVRARGEEVMTDAEGRVAEYRSEWQQLEKLLA